MGRFRHPARPPKLCYSRIRAHAAACRGFPPLALFGVRWIGGFPNYGLTFARTKHTENHPLLVTTPNEDVQETLDAPIESNTLPTFAELGISKDVVMKLTAAGITEPFPIQVLTIPDALAGRDICGKARTGSGKTLAFGLPMLERTTTSRPKHPHALVLVPTRELANQIVDVLAPLCAARGLWVGTIFGGASMYRQVEMLRAGLDIVVATPGRLNDLLDRGHVILDETTMVVIDEADQMADMGFMPQVERILEQVEGEHQTLLFSATLDGDVDKLVRKFQKEPIFQEVEETSDEAETMSHRFIGVQEAEKVAVAASIAAGPERTLMFVRTQRGADRLVQQLEREGVRADALHGGLSQPKRERVLRSFSNGQAPVLVATNLAARGIHVDDVNIVVHFDPPEEHKTYVHRSGRTARAGAAGVVVTLITPAQTRDMNVLRRMGGFREIIEPMTATDERLADLTAWEPQLEDFTAKPAPAMGANPSFARNRNYSNNRGGPAGGYGRDQRRFQPRASGERRSESFSGRAPQPVR